MGATLSKFAKLLTDADLATFGGGSTPLVFLSDGLKKMVPRVEDEGLRGTRSRVVDRITEDVIRVGGPIATEPSPAELDFWLQFILGGVKSGASIPVAETISPVAFASKRGPKWFQYDGCVAASAELASAGPGKRLQLTTNVVGKTETARETSFPSVAYDTVDVYMHHHLVVTIGGSISDGVHSGGTAYAPERASVKIDNGVQPKYRNSQTARDLVAGDRLIDVSLVLPWTDEEKALYEDGSDPFACSLVWTMDGGYSLGIYFPALIAARETPSIPGGVQEVTQPLNCRAYRTETEAEIQVENDSTAGT